MKNHKETKKPAASLSFMRRILFLCRELELSKYPNASTLAVACNCSRSTAMRTIESLRNDFGAPIEYDESNRGYRLTDSSYNFPAKPLSFPELTASLLVARISDSFNDSRLHGLLHSLGTKLTVGRADISRATRYVQEYVDIETLPSDSVGNVDLLKMLTLCANSSEVVVELPPGVIGSDQITVTGFAKKLVFRAGEAFLLVETHTTASHLIPLRYVEHQTNKALEKIADDPTSADSMNQKTLA